MFEVKVKKKRSVIARVNQVAPTIYAHMYINHTKLWMFISSDWFFNIKKEMKTATRVIIQIK